MSAIKSSTNEALVIDFGSSSIKMGYSGEDSPMTVLPSTEGSFPPGVECIEAVSSSSNTEIFGKTSHPLKRGVVTNWDQMEKMWNNMLNELDTGKYMPSIMLVESVKTKLEDRLKWAEMLFETLHVPSITFGNSATLSLFASGRTTGLIAECGAGTTTVAPIFEGLVLTYGTTTVDFGGQDISRNLQKSLAERGYNLDLSDVRIMKEKLASIKTTTANNNNNETIEYELPDGKIVNINSSILTDCTEQLINNKSTTPNGLKHQLLEGIRLCDDTIKRELATNIVLAGGTSMLNGLGDRLQTEISESLSDGKLGFTATQVTPSKYYSESGYKVQRKYAAWIGGSIIASLPTYKHLRVKRSEWEENRNAVLCQKCI